MGSGLFENMQIATLADLGELIESTLRRTTVRRGIAKWLYFLEPNSSMVQLLPITSRNCSQS